MGWTSQVLDPRDPWAPRRGADGVVFRPAVGSTETVARPANAVAKARPIVTIEASALGDALAGVLSPASDARFETGCAGSKCPSGHGCRAGRSECPLVVLLLDA